MKAKKKIFVRMPMMINGVWCVIISDGIAPTAKEIEIIECGSSRENAYQIYRRCKKEIGQGL
jgi:hypothetical protein